MAKRFRISRDQMITFGLILWVSFLSAGVATMVFFATFDPVDIAQLATYPMLMDRTTGYSLGFLLFWVLLILNSLMVVWLAKKKP